MRFSVSKTAADYPGNFPPGRLDQFMGFATPHAVPSFDGPLGELVRNLNSLDRVQSNENCWLLGSWAESDIPWLKRYFGIGQKLLQTILRSAVQKFANSGTAKKQMIAKYQCARSWECSDTAEKHMHLIRGNRFLIIQNFLVLLAVQWELHLGHNLWSRFICLPPLNHFNAINCLPSSTSITFACLPRAMLHDYVHIMRLSFIIRLWWFIDNIGSRQDLLSRSLMTEWN